MRSTQTMTGQRGLGIGFGEGNAFHLFSHEPNRGLINRLQLNNAFLHRLNRAVQVATPTLTLLSVLETVVSAEFGSLDLVPEMLALSLPDLLVDMNVTQLSKQIGLMVPRFSQTL